MAKTKRLQLTATAKASLGMLSLMSFLGGWNMMGQLAPASTPTPTPWPTLSQEVKLPPIPTMLPTLAPIAPVALPDLPQVNVNLPPAAIAPLPTLAALPTLAPLPTLVPLPVVEAPPPTRSGGS